MRSRSLVVLSLVSLALACRGGGTEPNGELTVEALVGTYNLFLVNGHRLPYRQPGLTNPTDDIVSGRMKLETSGFIRERAAHLLTWSNDVVTAADGADGHFAIAGDSVTITHTTDTAVGVARLDGTTITLFRSDTTYVYQRADSNVAVIDRLPLH